MKRLRGIAQVLELDFGAESKIDVQPEVEDEDPEVALAPQDNQAREFGPGLSQPWPSTNLEEKLTRLIQMVITEEN